MQEYEVKLKDIVVFQGRLYCVMKYRRITGTVTLAPVRPGHNRKYYLHDGEPRNFRASLVQQEVVLKEPYAQRHLAL